MTFNRLALNSQDFISKLKGKDRIEEEIITSFITQSESLNAEVPEFDSKLEWFNTSEALSFGNNLKGKIIVLDFFTYCCINCMHVLPDLHAVEQTHSIKNGVVVVGVHSAKFENEKTSSNILNAILRYDITHAVVNDNDAVMWTQMQIQCWPTFVVVSPDRKCLLYLVGEGHRDILLKFLDVAVKYYGEMGKLRNHSLPIKLAKTIMLKSTLRFPGKVCLAEEGLAIADTGNNRILLVDRGGMVIRSVGNTKAGFRDGRLTEACFNAPQGVEYLNGCLYVADTENHAIRKIDLQQNMVSTLAGTGVQGKDKEGGLVGVDQEISSPWDINFGPAPGLSSSKDAEKTVMYIAMAGTHQIWASYIMDGSWLKGGTQKAGTCIRFAGSGNEENRNNSYPHKASFAQPSGLTIATVNDKKYIYIADSESSCIRSIELSNGAVKACVGGERDPMNLFAYGDQDGKGIDAKLQHPLDVVWNPVDGMVYVADSYNHKIKIVNPLKCTCETLAGTGSSGFKDGQFLESQFNEPGGLEISVEGKQLYVADTNNHCIRIMDLEKQTVKKMEIFNPDDIDAVRVTTKGEKAQKTKTRLAPKNAPSHQLETMKRNLDLPVDFAISIRLPDECHYTEEAQSIFMITLGGTDENEVTELQRGQVNENGVIKTKVSLGGRNGPSVIVLIDILVYFCSPTGVCLMKSMVLRQPIQHDAQILENMVIKHSRTINL